MVNHNHLLNHLMCDMMVDDGMWLRVLNFLSDIGNMMCCGWWRKLLLLVTVPGVPGSSKVVSGRVVLIPRSLCVLLVVSKWKNMSDAVMS